MPSQTLTNPCPSCEAPLQFEAVSSMNPTRRPELKAAIMDHSLQRTPCNCGASVRLEPTLSYLDPENALWIVARPYPDLGDWKNQEQAAQALFDQALGAEAPGVAQEIGAGMSPRVVFGWPALREKVLARDLGLDEVVLECMKLALMRNQGIVPEAGQELRLVAEQGEDLVLSLVWPLTESTGDSYGTPRALHEEIKAQPGQWEAIQSQLVGPFLDAQRLFIDPR